MHSDCICRSGESCFHESFVLAVRRGSGGMEPSTSVDLCLYEPDGQLTVLSVLGFTSWKKVSDTDRVRGKHKTVKNQPIWIQKIVRQEHGLTLHAYPFSLIFFGEPIRLQHRQLTKVDPPRYWGESHALEYRRKYLALFDEASKPSSGRS